MSASNGRGSSLISDANSVGVNVETVPHQMIAPTQASSTSYIAVAIEWEAVIAPENGDSGILSYIVYWDAGNGAFIELVGETSQFTATTYTITTGITTGSTYQFKIKAVNKWGTGSFSPTNLSVLAASVPLQMTSPVTSIQASDGGVKIDFIKPDERGSPITAYKIEVKDSLGSFKQDLVNCDGSLSSIVTSLSCVIPMSSLRGLTFNLAFSALVEARVTAVNSIGESTPSEVDSSATTICTEPTIMGLPTEGSGTSES